MKLNNPTAPTMNSVKRFFEGKIENDLNIKISKRTLSQS